MESAVKVKCESLSLVTGEGVQEEEEQPVPLKMYEPSSLPITVRRSPRFGHAPPPQLNHHNAASKKSKSPRKSGSITSHNSRCLRRSSRFSPLSDAHPCQVPENEDNANGSSDSGRRRRFTQDKHSKLESAFAVVQEILQGPSPLVRQSFTVQEEIHRGNDFNSEATLPIASHLFLESPVKGISEFLSSYGSTPRASADVDAEPCFRPCLEDEDNKLMPADCSGPRVSPGFFLKNEDGVGTNLTRLSDETLLRSSPRHSFSLGGAVKIGVKSYFSGLSELLEERPSKRLMTCSQNSHFGRSNEMLLRRSPRFSAPGNGKLTRVFLQLPKSGKQHSSQRPGKENSSANKELSSSEMRRKKHKSSNSLIGDPIPNDEAREKWYWRYEMKSQGSKSRKVILEDDDEDKIVWNVECHYNQAEIDGCIFYLGDCAYIQGDGGKKHVGRIIELFKTTDGANYFRVQWFYRAEDTVMGEESAVHDEKRLFYSTVMNDNPLECIISKVNIVQISPWMGLKPQSIPPSDFYFDMEYCVDYSTFRTLPADNSFKRLRSSSSCSFVEAVSTTAGNNLSESKPDCKAELALLDLFSGCGGMSTGLCLGAKLSCVHLVTRWALDSDKSACQSLKLNHPEAHVRNEAAEDFLELLKEWQKLCKRYAASEIGIANQTRSRPSRLAKNEGPVTDNDVPPDEYEVSGLVDVCYGDHDDTGKRGLKFKVHWKGYDSSEDTWEPVEGLSNCQDCIRDFVRKGFKSKILPLPGDVDVICGGPPCQGISGYNRYRNVDSPLDDERNRQIVVFMDIVQFLKPKFVLMENVADILRFGKASLARYALSRLVHMRYQARFGVVAAGCYGIPQFRLRFFMWGAHPSEKLPQFPLPTHDVIVKCGPPTEFERNLVAYDEDQPRDIEKAVVLHDAISDLPAVSSHEDCEQITYDKPPETELQRFLRSTKYEISGSALSDNTKMNHVVNDHRPYSLTEEDYTRLCLIPKRKGANFRDLPGVVVGSDNVARRDPTKEQTLPSGKPLVPDFALNFEQGKSKRPYGRIWWDETVGTVVTYPDLHSQAVIHPEQDRVLTIRECARLQGFPDYYGFRGTVKERYRQIGNAVAVPVGRALGFALGMAFQGLNGEEPLMKLPPKFSHSTNSQLAGSVFQKAE